MLRQNGADRAGRRRVIGQGISEVITFAIGVAISPLPIIAVILMLFSPRARLNGPAFLLGWAVALGAVSTIVYVVTDASDAATDSGASDTTSTIKVVLGVVLLAMAMRRWRHRDQQTATPKWMQSIDSFTPVRAFALAVALAAVNPKNLVLTIGAAAGLGQLGVDTGAAVVAIIVFVALASLSIAVPVVLYLIGGEHARARLDSLKDWMERHNAAVMSVVLLIFGVLLISKGLGLLST
jgi:hypothetical protein